MHLLQVGEVMNETPAPESKPVQGAFLVKITDPDLPMAQ